MISKKKKKVQTSFYSEKPMIQDKSRHWPTLKLCSPNGVVLTSEWHLKAINKHDVIIMEWAESTTWRGRSNETLWKHVGLSHRRLQWSHCHTLRQSEQVLMMKEGWVSYLSWSFIFISHQFRDFKKSQTFCASRNHLCLHTLWKVFIQLLK